MISWIKKELKEGKTLISYGMIGIGSNGLSFLVPIVLAMLFKPELFGIYSLGMMIVYFFNSSLILSSGKPSVVYGNNEIAETQKISYTVTARIILLSISVVIILVIILLFKQQIADFTGLTGTQVYFLIFVFVGKAMESLMICIFLSLNERIRQSVFKLITAGLYIICLSVVYLFFEISLESIFLIFFVAPVISCSLFIPKLDFKKILPLAYDKEILKKMTDYTKWMMFGGTAVYLLNWGDNLILRRFSSMEEIGVYNLGYQFFKGTIILMAMINMYYLPFIAKNIDNKEKITKYLLNKRIKLIVLGVIFLMALFFVVPVFVKLFYKGLYQDSVVVFRILIFGSLCALYNMFYIPIFDSLERYKFTQIVIAVCVVFNLLLDYILVHRIGFVGAAIATSVTYFLIAVINEVYFRKYCRSRVM